MASAYIAWYLFFAGAGAGAFAIASVVDFALRLAPRPHLLKISPITDAGMVLGPIMVAVGCVFLLLDLGDPSIAFNVFLRPLSILGFGSWAIVLFCLFAALSLAFGLMPHCRASKLIEPLSQFLAMILSFVVILYSGVFYSLFPSVPFLNTLLVPALFTVSAFSSGAGLLVVVGFFRQTCEGVLEGMNGLSAIDAVIVLVEILLLTALLARPVLFSESDASLSAFALLFGDLSLLFWVGVVIVGCVVPLAVDLMCFARLRPTVLCIGGISALVGGVCLRFCILMAASRFAIGFVAVQPFWV